ncbi:uncharacterized protein LY89DRAFT_196776 [Mollisia scopiformis]|uniref:Uncharacterized protein n=1 Tax=Mollisia scopiformis TaxID=149040 RepID=A0A194WY54_MOLSC|nr:uncharacterized protein LY89DRAFT_196776 [Mollisia scopiformis]KUJ12906.1 hypothetical protein LY89DRAFT_196776 [Mollisia scopiformis]
MMAACLLAQIVSVSRGGRTMTRSILSSIFLGEKKRPTEDFLGRSTKLLPPKCLSFFIIVQIHVQFSSTLTPAEVGDAETVLKRARLASGYAAIHLPYASILR